MIAAAVVAAAVINSFKYRRGLIDESVLFFCLLSLTDYLSLWYDIFRVRGVAQFGSVRGLGPWGRGFESLRPDFAGVT